MAEIPEVAEAKGKLRKLVGPAVDALEGLLESDIAGIQLGAAKEILDRGGVPARHEVQATIEVGLDEEIEQLLTQVKRQITHRNTPSDLLDGIEDAVLIEEEAFAELPVGEQAAAFIGVPLDDIEVEAEVETDRVAWWQAVPPDEIEIG